MGDRLRVMLGVWLGVYPSVLVLTYLLEPFGLPLWLSVLISTSLTVPLITFVVVPMTRKAVARIEDKAVEELED